jgi:hypothetical protein
MGLGNLPFSLLNFPEKFPHQSIPFNSDKKTVSISSLMSLF